jgi:fermentation-respiration switch protein FrsA (DUF1100 family)
MSTPRKRSLWRFLRRGLLFIGFLYLGVLLLMWSFENSLVYPRETAADHWEDPPDPAFEDVTFTTKDGTTIHAWYLPREGSSETMIFCHGNGGNLSYMGRSMLRFRETLGCSVLAFDYPGYGKSGGKPSEEGCYASVEAGLEYLAQVKAIPPHRVTLIGDSLGGAVAIEVARRRPCRAVVVSKTFTSLPAVAKLRFWFLPVGWLMRNRFNSIAKLPEVHVPILIAGATEDKLVPFAMSKELFDAANEPKELFPLQGEDHGGKLTDEFMLAIRRFLDRQPLPRHSKPSDL